MTDSHDDSLFSGEGIPSKYTIHNARTRIFVPEEVDVRALRINLSLDYFKRNKPRWYFVEEKREIFFDEDPRALTLKHFKGCHVYRRTWKKARFNDVDITTESNGQKRLTLDVGENNMTVSELMKKGVPTEEIVYTLQRLITKLNHDIPNDNFKEEKVEIGEET